MIPICEICVDVLQARWAAERPGASGQWLCGPDEIRSAHAYARPLEIQLLLSNVAGVARLDGVTAASGHSAALIGLAMMLIPGAKKRGAD
jgi:hypothetical protein